MQDVNERARSAVRAFRAMQYGLTAYARAISGDRNVVVEVSTGVPRTDGKKIYYQPPLSLADNLAHERRLCDKRDENRKLVCPACALREEILVNIYHEIAHIAFKSFDAVSDHGKRVALEKGLVGLSARRAEAVKRRINEANSFEKNSYQALANLIDPYLPFLLNCIEDARVDAAMCKARPGVRVMLESSVYSIFTEGAEQVDGKRLFWRDRPLNPQAGIACYLRAAGYRGWEQYLDDVVADAFNDDQLNSYLSRIKEAESALDSFEISFHVFDRLKDLGFFKTEEDEDEQDSQGDSQAQGQQDSSSSGEGDGSSSDEVPGDDSNESQQADRSSRSSGDANSNEDNQGSNREPSGGAEEESVNEAEPSRNDGKSDDSSDESDEDASGGSGGEQGSEDADSSGDHEGDSSGTGNGATEGDDAGSEPEDEASVCNGSDSSSDASKSAGDGNRDSLGDEGQDPSSLHQSGGVIDTGADEGIGGIVSEERNYGTPEDTKGVLEVIHKDDVVVDHHSHDTSQDEREAVKTAIIQGQYFEKPSVGVSGVREHYYGKMSRYGDSEITPWAWNKRYSSYGFTDDELGIDVDLDIPESIIGPALLKMRRVFTDNAVAAHQHNLKSGRINKRVLGRRAWNDDDRLFSKKRLPGKKSYAVLIGIDISGSTVGVNLALAKRAAWAQAELCQRTGVKFAIFAHSGSQESGKLGRSSQLVLDMYHVKDFDQPWDKPTQKALAGLGSDSENLDGHSIEFYRKHIASVDATDKIILYYSDGKMPAANHDEELGILKDEIINCKRDGITLLGVGIRTNSPKKHGLDTVQVDSDEDLVNVVMHLEKEMLRRAR